MKLCKFCGSYILSGDYCVCCNRGSSHNIDVDHDSVDHDSVDHDSVDHDSVDEQLSQDGPFLFTFFQLLTLQMDIARLNRMSLWPFKRWFHNGEIKAYEYAIKIIEKKIYNLLSDK